jgi:outer membrane protein
MMRRPAMLLLLMCVAGCAIDQQTDVDRYRELLDARVPPVDVPPEPLDLRSAMGMASLHSEGLARQGEAYVRALSQQRRSESLWLPTINLAPSWAFSDVQEGGSSGSTFNVPVAALLRVEPVSDTHRRWRDRLISEQRELELIDAQDQLLSDVAAAFYLVLRAEAGRSVLVQSLEAQEQRLSDIRGRLDAGVARPLDVAQIEAQVSETRTRLINARRDVAVSRQLLKFYLRHADADLPLVDSLIVPDLAADTDWLERAAMRRADLLATGKASQAARAEVEVAAGQYVPSVGLDVSVFLYRESNPTSRALDAILRLNLPLFSASRIEQDIRAAWSFYRTARLLQSEVARDVERTVLSALIELRASGDRLREARVRLTSAEQAYRQAEESYRAGLATNLERIIAQDQLLDAQLFLSNEAFDQKLLYLRLLRQVGELSDLTR